MTGAERGFLLLTSHLGNPERKPLTPAQMRTLSQRAAMLSREDRDLTEKDLLLLGYSREMATRILALLSEEALLDYTLIQGRRQDCCPISRVNGHYPENLSHRLGPNRAFAAAVGQYAARQKLTLISGNARGADRMAQEACLASGGNVISIVADDLSKQPLQEHILYLSEEDFDAPFTTQRALSRNRLIHALGAMVFVAQSDVGTGGTWSGCTQNLRHGWSPVICFRDGSAAAQALEDLGAYLIREEELGEFRVISGEEISFF